MVMKILIDHIGFEAGGRKQALAACEKTEFLSSNAVFSLLCGGLPVFEGKPSERLSVDGWKNRYYYILDFSEIDVEGLYSLRLTDGELGVDSSEFMVADNLIPDKTISDILFYFKSQRCSWRWDEADAKTPFFGERTDRFNLSGGWYDASGDYSKYLSHLSYANYMNPQQTPLVVWSLFLLHEQLSADSRYGGTLLEDRALEEGLHGADFLMRMQDPEGYFYTTVFDGWSKDPERRIVASFRGMEGELSGDYQAGYRQGGGLCIAALARAARSESGEYTSEEYLAAAVRGFEHLQQHNTEYLDNGRENIIDSYCALTAAVELFKSTGKERFLEAARSRAGELEELYNYGGGYWSVENGSRRPYFHASDAGFPIIALIDYIDIEYSGPEKERAAALVETAVRDLLKLRGGSEANPFMLARQQVMPVGGEIRASYFIPHENETGYWWQGENARLASLAAAFRKASVLFKDRPGNFLKELEGFADYQIHWILGLNPYDICMMQGHGRNNPRYEDHYPNAPGGICNGITAGYADEMDIDFLPAELDGRGDHRWRWSEQWLPHAAWFILAAVAEFEIKRNT